MEAVGTDMSCFNETLNKCYADQEPSEKCRSAAAVNAPASSLDPYFDCSICLDFAVDPVVTLCGHLYCWPCIYKWLQVETTSPQQCPVCKAPVSQNALVPLYGRGNLTTHPKGSRKSRNIPNRPSVLRDMISSVIEEQHSSTTNGGEYIDLHSPTMQRRQLHHQNHYDSLYPSQLGGTSVFSSTAGGVIGGIAVSILPLLSRNSYLSRPYQLEANWSTARERRQEQRVEESLHQLWVFLLCGAVLCLLFF